MGSVPDSVELEELAALVESFGVIDSMRLVRPKSCAFINFADETVARALQVCTHLLSPRHSIPRKSGFISRCCPFLFSLYLLGSPFPVLTSL